jgi:hypothetical protein
VEAWPNPPDDTHCASLIVGLNKAAYAFVSKMIESGDIGFFREFGDRLDGKAKSSLEMSGPDGDAIPVNVGIQFVSGTVPRET